MKTIQFDIGSNCTVSLPPDIVAEQLAEYVRTLNKQHSYTIGAYYSEIGGVYVGTIRGDDGVIYGLVAAGELEGKAEWGTCDTPELTDWDGYTNTLILHPYSLAAEMATLHESNSLADFYLPSLREMLVAAANIPKFFDPSTPHWTSTHFKGEMAYAVDFNRRTTCSSKGTTKFVIHPFRRFIVQGAE